MPSLKWLSPGRFSLHPGGGGSDKVLRLCNTSTLIIAFLTFQLRLCVIADCAPRPSVPTLSYGRASYCIRTPGMTRTYVAKELYGGLGLIVGLLSQLSCCKLSQRFLRIASMLKPFLASLLSTAVECNKS